MQSAATDKPDIQAIMKLLSHSKSHIVTLSDGSVWQIFPGDLDLTLSWLPDSELKIIAIEDDVASHVLLDAASGGFVRVRPADEEWPEDAVRNALKGR